MNDEMLPNRDADPRWVLPTILTSVLEGLARVVNRDEGRTPIVKGISRSGLTLQGLSKVTQRYFEKADIMMQVLTRSEFKTLCWISSMLILTVGGCHPSHAQTTQATSSALLANQSQTNGIQEQQPAYTLSVSSQLVTLDVVVNDKSGQPVRGLKRDDFAIYEDDIPQPIVSFEASEPKRVTGRGPIEIHSTAELDRLKPDAPVSIVVLDELTTKFEDQYFARYSLEKYLGKQGEILDQPLMLMARSLDHTQVLHDYTTSKREILDTLNRHFVGNDWRAADPNWTNEHILAAFASLIEIAKATQGHSGHKNLIWIGRGFPTIQPAM